MNITVLNFFRDISKEQDKSVDISSQNVALSFFYLLILKKRVCVKISKRCS